MTHDWREQGERSSPLMIRLLVRSALILGRSIMRVVLWPVVLYFWVTHSEARAASRNYLARVTGGPVAGWQILRHFHCFATASVDRVYLLRNRTGSLSMDTEYGPGARETLMSGCGCILIVAHFGSFEALRVPALRRGARTVRIVLDRAVGRMATAVFEQLDPRLAAGIIDAARPGFEVILEVKKALDGGDIVGIMADRARSDERLVTVDFLGGRAQFPAGPWLIAAGLGAPVILGFGVLRDGRYRCGLELFAQRVSIPRATRDSSARTVAQQYATRLEQAVRAAPYNWFNFYDYWLPDDAPETARH
jgi:predicted LPLAT superfamily acyltransferase